MAEHSDLADEADPFALGARQNAEPPPAWAARALIPDELVEPDLLRDHEDLLFRLHRLLRPATYLEVGVNEGHSLRWALDGTVAVAVDPALDVLDLPPAPVGTTFLALPSDDAFAHPALATTLGSSIDLAFVDGLHLVEQVLRDVANVEALSHPGTVLVLDDPLPPEPAAAERERSTLLWTGDVWRAVVVLRRRRPDLQVTTLSVPPSGATIITSLDRTSTVLTERHDELVAEVLELDWATDGLGHEDEALGLRAGTWSEVLGLLPTPS